MSSEDFQLLDDEKIDNSIIKSDFVKIYHQNGQVNDESQGVNFFLGEKLNYLQIGNSYLEFDIKLRKAENTNIVTSNDVATNEVIRLVNNAFAYTIHDARISTSSGTEIGQNNFVCPVSTIMRSVTLKDGDLSTYFYIIDESEAVIINSSLKQILINTQYRGNIRGHLPLEFFLDFVVRLKK